MIACRRSSGRGSVVKNDESRFPTHVSILSPRRSETSISIPQ